MTKSITLIPVILMMFATFAFGTDYNTHFIKMKRGDVSVEAAVRIDLRLLTSYKTERTIYMPSGKFSDRFVPEHSVGDFLNPARSMLWDFLKTVNKDRLYKGHIKFVITYNVDSTTYAYKTYAYKLCDSEGEWFVIE